MQGRAEFPYYGACALSSRQLEHGVVHVSVTGELDLHTSPLLERELAPLGDRIVVDLTDCEFLDSTAVGVLVATRTRLAGTGRIELVAPGSQVRRLLELTGLAAVFTIHDSRDSALRAAPDV